MAAIRDRSRREPFSRSIRSWYRSYPMRSQLIGPVVAATSAGAAPVLVSPLAGNDVGAGPPFLGALADRKMLNAAKQMTAANDSFRKRAREIIGRLQV